MHKLFVICAFMKRSKGRVALTQMLTQHPCLWRNNAAIFFTGARVRHTAVVHTSDKTKSAGGDTQQTPKPAVTTATRERWVAPVQGPIPGTE